MVAMIPIATSVLLSIFRGNGHHNTLHRSHVCTLVTRYFSFYSFRYTSLLLVLNRVHGHYITLLNRFFLSTLSNEP
jgi:hypothetical protein